MYLSEKNNEVNYNVEYKMVKLKLAFNAKYIKNGN